jgi:hypothetical protein
LKSRPKQLLGYLPLASALPDLYMYVQVPFAWLQIFNDGKHSSLLQQKRFYRASAPVGLLSYFYSHLMTQIAQ